MKRYLLATVLAVLVPAMLSAAEPLRIFIRSGPKSHGPGAHDHPAFLRDWVPLLNERGAKAVGGNEFPTKEQLDQTDVLVLHTDNGGDIKIGQERKNLLEFLERGGGLVTIHAASVSKDHDWFKGIIGGSWHHGRTKWLEGPMHLYFTDKDNPITRDMSNWAMDDEIYYDMDLLPECRILAGAYTPKPSGARNEKANKRAEELTGGGKKVSVYDIQPQVWTYEKDKYRSFVSIPGHHYANFNRPNFRALLLRGIAWAGKRENVDELCRPEELGDNLRYVEGGPVRPEKAAATLEVHPDFDISLVAAEPLINKVMNVDWDSKGRLWVCETPEYPNGRRMPNIDDPWKDSGSRLPYQTDRDPIDRISILSDTNGDGVMDKKQVFADKLELVTSFCFYKKGVIACNAPDIWFLEDTDGDDVCDTRTKLYSGLGMGDTHAVINNLRWGLDGWVYATHGYSAGDVTALGEGGAKESTRIGSGVIRFKPDGSHIEQYSSRGGNTWGLNMTWDGQTFWTQPTSGTVLFHTVVPEYVLAKGKIPGTNSWNGLITHQKTFPAMSWPEQAYVQIDLVGEFTAAAGCAIYEGGAWPDKWNYSYFTTEPTLNIVHHEFITPDGPTYKAAKEAGREETEFIRSKDLWFRPIETRIGPDGALYVVDFYNQAVIHNDTRGPKHGPANAAVRPDRDHYFGRLWKVQHKQAKKLEVPVLDGMTLDQLDAICQSSPNAHVKQTAWRLIQERGDEAKGTKTAFQVSQRIGSPVMRSYGKVASSDSAKGLADIFERFEGTNEDEVWMRSALIAAASDFPVDAVTQALAHPEAAKLEALVTNVLPTALKDKSTEHAAQFIQACASASNKADRLKLAILQGIAQQLTDVPTLTPELATALKTLINNPVTASATLPLVTRWDKAGSLADEVKTLLTSLTSQLADNTAQLELRIAAAEALIGVGGEARSRVIPTLSDEKTPQALQEAIIKSLGENGGGEHLVAAFSGLKPALRGSAFDQILKRPEASLALLTALEKGEVKPSDIGPGNVARLRTHPNKQVAKRAAAMLDKLNPDTKAKNELIAQLIHEVEKPGDGVKGKMLFTAACAVCHKLGGVGKDVAPPLTGMGAHGPGELLVHIVDPNREVDPSFWAWNITKKSGETFQGIIASENAASVVLRNQAGDFEIKKTDIANRENTHTSLMPEGLHALGGENLRDILAFICGDEQAYRVLDLRNIYTGDSRQGAFRGVEHVDETVTLHKFGNVTVQSVPFFIMDPAKAPTGSNLIILKGGGEKMPAHEFPQRVEIPTHANAASLHFLGGVAGWGWPAGGDQAKGKPAMKVVVNFADGDSEEFELKNGEHFVDYIGRTAVPLSDDAGDFTRRGQLRYFALNLKKKGTLKSIALESYNNGITPCTVAVTVGQEKSNWKPHYEPESASKKSASGEIGPKEGGKGDGPLAPVQQAHWEAGKTKVLLIGGGSSHNFAKFFGDADGETLKAAGFSVVYTEDRDQAAAELKNADVAIISVNRKFFDTAAYRKALFDRIAAGKGVIMLHPGTWYGYGQWPELNAQIVGGGARGHDKIHTFEVKTVKSHPIMAEVPTSFTVEDELYYINAEPDKIPAGTAKIEVLAETSPSDKYKAGHPSVWITQNDNARIVGIALGHDERTHSHPAYQKILVNAARWVSEGK